MNSEKPILAIIGGAGHQAASRLHQALLDRFAPLSTLDEHYPEVVLVNRHIPGVDLTGITDPCRADACLGDRIAAAHALGATHCLLACASLHCLPSARRCLDWISLGASAALAAGATRVGIIASRSARQAGLFEHALAPMGILAVHHPDQDRVDRLIAKCLPGKLDPGMVDEFQSLRADLLARSGLAWRACTELSLLPGLPRDLSSQDLMLQSLLQAMGARS